LLQGLQYNYGQDTDMKYSWVLIFSSFSDEDLSRDFECESDVLSHS